MSDPITDQALAQRMAVESLAMDMADTFIPWAEGFPLAERLVAANDPQVRQRIFDMERAIHVLRRVGFAPVYVEADHE